MSFSFGVNTAKTTSGFTLGASSLTTAIPGAGGDVKAPTLSFSGAVTPAKTTATVTPLAAPAFTFTQSGFTLGQTPSTQTTVFPLGSTQATTTTSSGFNVGTIFSVTPSTTSVTPATQAATVSQAAPTTSTPLFFGTPATTTSSSTLKLNLQLPTATVSTTSVAPASTAITTTVSSSSVPAPLTAINFNQFQENINKWKIVLEEEEEHLMNQAAQITVWDKLLISNSEKIVALNDEVTVMKLLQEQLDHELDLILSQQGELEECLSSLEKSLDSLPANPDPERENIYSKAESLDTQLKQMSEDLKEIIEQLNEANRSQDNSDPIVQIGRILNAHMNSLQWIDQNTANIQSRLDSVSKLHDIHHRESERCFRLSFE